MLLSTFRKKMAVFTLVLSVTGCAHSQALSPNENDPLEPLNRELYSFHTWIDTHFFKPIAMSYRAIVPTRVRASVNNVFANVDEIPITINNLLQGEFKRAGRSTQRFAINSTAGVLGLFDVATDMGCERIRTDLGQTLYKWGWKESSYLFIPLFGPTTIRDGIGTAGDAYMMPWPYLAEEWVWTAFGVYAVNERAKLIDSEALLSIAALDEYAFIRDGYLEHRKSFVGDLSSDEDLMQEDWGDIL